MKPESRFSGTAIKYRRNATVIAGDVDFSLARFRFVNFILHSNLNDLIV